jgi:periplasmic protein TonB
MRDDAFLNECLVDGQTGTQRRRSRRRRGSLAAALVFEGAVVAGLALWPLFTPATPPPRFAVVTHVPYLGEVRLPHSAQASAPNPRSERRMTIPDFSRPQTLAQNTRARAAALQNVPVPIIGDENPQDPFGNPGVPGGFGAGPVVPTKPESANARIIRRSEQIQEGQLITRITPSYPQIARMARITGTVELMVLVGRDGGVLSVEVLSGNPLLAPAAKQAVEQWRYRPAILDGQAVEVEARVTVKFVMDE